MITYEMPEGDGVLTVQGYDDEEDEYMKEHKPHQIEQIQLVDESAAECIDYYFDGGTDGDKQDVIDRCCIKAKMSKGDLAQSVMLLADESASWAGGFSAGLWDLLAWVRHVSRQISDGFVFRDSPQQHRDGTRLVKTTIRLTAHQHAALAILAQGPDADESVPAAQIIRILVRRHLNKVAR